LCSKNIKCIFLPVLNLKIFGISHVIGRSLLLLLDLKDHSLKSDTWVFLGGIICSFIHMYIHCLGHHSLNPLPPPTLLIPLTLRQSLFCPLLQFCWRENISNRKDIAFLLDWDKESCTLRFLALLPCTCVLQHELVNLYETSYLHPGHLSLSQFKITI
jgi:hypothetical protein